MQLGHPVFERPGRPSGLRAGPRLVPEGSGGRRCRGHENGLGVSQDYAHARAWFHKAADIGNKKAAEDLSRRCRFFGGAGFADASLHDLEVATGVNKSGLYSEFKDKEDLFRQSLRYYLESLEKKGLLTAEPLGWNNGAET